MAPTPPIENPTPTLTDLPDHVLGKIVKNADKNSIKSLSKVSKNIRNEVMPEVIKRFRAQLYDWDDKKNMMSGTENVYFGIHFRRINNYSSSSSNGSSSNGSSSNGNWSSGGGEYVDTDIETDVGLFVKTNVKNKSLLFISITDKSPTPIDESDICPLWQASGPTRSTVYRKAIPKPMLQFIAHACLKRLTYLSSPKNTSGIEIEILNGALENLVTFTNTMPQDFCSKYFNSTTVKKGSQDQNASLQSLEVRKKIQSQLEKWSEMTKGTAMVYFGTYMETREIPPEGGEYVIEKELDVGLYIKTPEYYVNGHLVFISLTGDGVLLMEKEHEYEDSGYENTFESKTLPLPILQFIALMSLRRLEYKITELQTFDEDKLADIAPLEPDMIMKTYESSFGALKKYIKESNIPDDLCNLCFDTTSQEGGKTSTRRGMKQYVKLPKKYKGKDGVERVLYQKHDSLYVKRKSAKTGKMVYRKVTV